MDLFVFELAGRTDVGRARARNEDAFEVDEANAVIVVADGMGGHPSGDIASRIAADVVCRRLVDGDTADTTVMSAILEADREIKRVAREEPESEGMGTTVVALSADRRTGFFTIGHVGDSRAYLIRKGDIEQLTRDDSWVQDQVDAGSLQADAARTHRWSSVITQSLGAVELFDPNVTMGVLKGGDVLLVCSDGLSGMIEDQQIAEIVSKGSSEDLETLVAALIREANEAGGYDNITVALLRVSTKPAE